MFGHPPEKLLPMLKAEPKSIAPLTREMFAVSFAIPKRAF